MICHPDKSTHTTPTINKKINRWSSSTVESFHLKKIQKTRFFKIHHQMDQYHITLKSPREEVTSYKARKKKSIGYVTARSYERDFSPGVRNSVMLINDMNHPNVVKFHNWYETRNHLWVVEEYCVGGTLRSLRSQDRYEPECSVRRFGVDLMAGIEIRSRTRYHCVETF